MVSKLVLAILRAWVRVSLGATFIWPCGTSKQKKLSKFPDIWLRFQKVTLFSMKFLKGSRAYIYIYIYIFRQHFFVHANFIKHNRHFMPTYSLLDPFEFPYYFYRIRGELIEVLSIVVCIPSSFCPTLGYHQGRICYNSDVTFVLANYYCVRTSLLLEIMALAFKCNSVNSASS